MTRSEAIAQLTRTRSLSTDLLGPLGISMDHWLQWCQRSDSDEILTQLIDALNQGET